MLAVGRGERLSLPPQVPAELTPEVPELLRTIEERLAMIEELPTITTQAQPSRALRGLRTYGLVR